MPDAARMLQAYDDHLRIEAPSAIASTRHGPLLLATFPGGRGWVTYRELGGADAPAIRALVADALDHYLADPAIERVDWKTRGHDHAPGLHDALVEQGFEEGRRGLSGSAAARFREHVMVVHRSHSLVVVGHRGDRPDPADVTGTGWMVGIPECTCPSRT